VINTRDISPVLARIENNGFVAVQKSDSTTIYTDFIHCTHTTNSEQKKQKNKLLLPMFHIQESNFGPSAKKERTIIIVLDIVILSSSLNLATMQHIAGPEFEKLPVLRRMVYEETAIDRMHSLSLLRFDGSIQNIEI
jgi:hypothetical protein